MRAEMNLAALFAFSLANLCYGNVVDSSKLVAKTAELKHSLQRNGDDTDTAIVYKIRKGSCKCVNLQGDQCDVEMTEESVLKAKGKSCAKGQRYCCAREKHLVDLSKPSSAFAGEKGQPLSTSLLRDEISNYAKVVMASDVDENPSKAAEGTNKGDSAADQGVPFIRPSVLRAILSFLTEGIKFLTNVFSK